MKKKIIIAILLVLLTIIVGILLFTKNVHYADENTLYFAKFNDKILRFEHIDHVIPQNQIVAVEESTDNGKTFKTITEGQVIVSLEPKFVFLNENLGFAVKKPNNIKEKGKYYGMYVTKDGGKTFNLSEINYDNPSIEVLTIKDVPLYKDGKLKLPCSVYQIVDDSGYKDIDLFFVTDDDGLTWYLDNEELSLNLKSNTLTNSGGTFILKNNSLFDYAYGPEYYIEKKENNAWHEIELEEPLSWNAVLYTLKSNEEIEININWSIGYGLLPSGEYRLVKANLRKANSSDSRSYRVYAEFKIPGKVIAGTANTIEVQKKDFQDTNKFNEYLKRDGQTIYLASNIKEIYYDNVKKKHVLKDYVEKTYQTIDDSIKHLINYLTPVSELNDGGTRIYKSQEYDITIVKCNTISGNKDYYIGDYNMNFDGNLICKE